MFLKWMWGGIAAYFVVFWFAVGDLGIAVACTFFLVVIGLKATIAAMGQVQASENHIPPDPTLPANLNQPPR